MALRRSDLLVKACIGVALLAVLGCGVWLLGGPETAGTSTAAPAPSESTLQASFIDLDVPALAAYAEAIVVGRVHGAQTTSRGITLSEESRAKLRAEGYADSEIDSWVEFEDYVVHTTSVFEIRDALKGGFLSGDIVEVRHVGGVYGNHATDAPGFPQLRPGHEYVLILARTFDGAWEVAKAYEIDKGTATSVLGGKTESVPLEELLAMIRQHVNDPNPFEAAEPVEETTTPHSAPAALPADEASHTTAP